MAFLQAARRTGCEVEAVESDGTGQIDVDDLRRRLESCRGWRSGARAA